MSDEEQLDAFDEDLFDPQELVQVNKNNLINEYLDSVIIKANEFPFSNTKEKAIGHEFIGEINGIVARYKNRVK